MSNLNVEEIKALLLFLDRVTMQGKEAQVWNVLVNKLENMYKSLTLMSSESKVDNK
jgi:hypothetical protein